MDQFLKQFNDTEKLSKPLGERTLNFGRHKGKTYDEVYDTDKSYVKWIVTTNDKYTKLIKKYFTERIEKDYSNSP